MLKQILIEHYKIPAHKITPVGTGRGVISPSTVKKIIKQSKYSSQPKVVSKTKEASVLAAFEKAYAANQKPTTNHRRSKQLPTTNRPSGN